jgi:UDP-N-acetylglucosamine 2-epimerase (non-hydrolysing)
MIYVLIGTRAQLIKMAPVMIELKKRGAPYTYVSTAQHADTMDELHEDFGIRAPDFYLAELNERKTVFGLVYWFFKILLTALFRRPKWFSSKGIGLIHGDTLSTLLGAILLKLTGNKVGHVESGLRSHNLWNPFPEEIIRILTFSFTDIYFCPDDTAINNVRSYNGQKINTCGNTLIDGVRQARQKLQLREPNAAPYCVFSFHRYENLRSNARTRFIIEAIKLSATKRTTIVIMHPLTGHILSKSNTIEELKKTANVVLSPRMGFNNFIGLISDADYLITDGGSNQEEASYLGVPCAVLRSHTERLEGLGLNSILIAFNQMKLENFIFNFDDYARPAVANEGSPSQLIVDAIHKAVSVKR